MPDGAVSETSGVVTRAFNTDDISAGGDGRANGPLFLDQNASFTCGFLKSVTCPGKAVVAAVAVQTCTPRFSVFGAVGPRPIVEEKVGGMSQTADRTGMPRAEQANENWPSKRLVVHASPYLSTAATRRRGHWLLNWEGDLVSGELIEASVVGATPWCRREGRLCRVGRAICRSYFFRPI